MNATKPYRANNGTEIIDHILLTFRKALENTGHFEHHLTMHDYSFVGGVKISIAHRKPVEVKFSASGEGTEEGQAGDLVREELTIPAESPSLPPDRVREMLLAGQPEGKNEPLESLSDLPVAIPVDEPDGVVHADAIESPIIHDLAELQAANPDSDIKPGDVPSGILGFSGFRPPVDASEPVEALLEAKDFAEEGSTDVEIGASGEDSPAMLENTPSAPKRRQYFSKHLKKEGQNE